MNTELDLLDDILERNDAQALNRFLEFCEETRLFSENNQAANDLIPVINRLLNEAPKRELGALLLKAFLSQCPLNLIGPHVFTWIQQCIRGMLTVRETTLVGVSLNLMGDLVPLSLKFPDVKREVSQTLSLRIVDCFRDLAQTEHKLLALRCLNEFLQGYGKSCGPAKDSLFKFLLNLIDCSDVIQAAGQCYLSIAAIGNPGSEYENFKASWEDQQTFLINCLNFVLNGLFDGVSEIQGPSNLTLIKEINLTLPPILDQHPLSRSIKRAAQFKGLAEYLCSMITGKFVTNKKLSLESLLGVVCRTLAVNRDTVKSNLSLDSLYVAMQIPVIHEAAIRILSCLIASCRMNLVTHGELICKLLVQSLKCTQADDWPYGQVKPYSLLRTSTYNCLEMWLSISRSSSNVKNSLHNVVLAVLYDLCRNKPAVQINVQTKHVKGREGKRQRQAALAMSGSPEELENDRGYRQVDVELIIACLKSLSALFLACGCQLDIEDLKNLRLEVIVQLRTVQAEIFNPPPFPFDNDDCRLQLYDTFFTICSVRRPDFVPPLNLAHSLFSQGLQDPQPKIVTFCGKAANYINRLIQPHAPTLEFEPIQYTSSDIVRLSTNPSSLFLPTLTKKSKRPKKLKIRLKTCENPAAESSNTPLENDKDPPRNSHGANDSNPTPPPRVNQETDREVSLVSDSSPCQPTEESNQIELSMTDDEIVEIPPNEHSPPHKRSVENGVDSDEKRAKSSGGSEEAVCLNATVENVRNSDGDLNELEKSMLSSFINVIDD